MAALRRKRGNIFICSLKLSPFVVAEGAEA
jgi:hypothetical protein